MPLGAIGVARTPPTCTGGAQAATAIVRPAVAIRNRADQHRDTVRSTDTAHPGKEGRLASMIFHSAMELRCGDHRVILTPKIRTI